MNKISFGTILQIIQIIALGYLLFKVLQPTSSTDVLNSIEMNRVEIKKQQELIMETNKAAMLKYDSMNQRSMKRIDSTFNKIKVDLDQVKKINQNIKDLTKIFDENRVDLPNPDKY